MCTEKNSELPDGHDGEIYKGRDVLLGNHITDEESTWAVFSDLGSSPPTLEACRNLDALSDLPWYETKTGDAKGAYCQSYPEGEDGVVAWVSVPEHRWPNEWVAEYQNPVVELTLELYGHPESVRFGRMTVPP